MSSLTASELEHLLAILPEPVAANEPNLNLSFLQMFTSLGRERLSRLITEHTFPPGEVLFWEDEPGDALYIILSGMVAAIKGKLEAPTFLGYRGAGEVLGEMALLEDQPRSATGITARECRLMRLGREDFQAMVREYPEIGMNIMKEMSRRLRAADHARHASLVDARELVNQVSTLQSEKRQLLELQRIRQETSDLIVHDLRNPLQGIVGTLQLLPIVLPEEIWQANHELLEMAQAASERMRLLVDTLLDVARMENGDVRLDLAPVALPGLIESVTQRISNFSRHETRLEISCQTNLPTTLADINLLDRVLTNLIDNAFKHTPRGELITIAAEAVNGEIQVSVTDTGPGIPPEDRERIFERFAQTHDEKRQRRGFGLGLTFCRLTILAHQGRIWVEPGPEGKGSRFIFCLPASTAKK